MDYETLLRVLDHSADGIFIWDRETRLAYVNEPALKQNMTQHSDMIGKSWDELKKNNLVFGQFVKMAFEEKRIVSGKTIGPSGMAKFITCTPVFDPKGNIEYLIAVVRELNNLISDLDKLDIPLGVFDVRKENSVQEKALCLTGSKVSKGIINTISKMAETNATVLILGESGTGKSEIARLIHKYGSRKAKPFVTVNCGAIPENLMEAAFFGYEKGAFTGATGMKQGYFEVAEQGTIFLDEIGDLPLAMQVKLLRVLQDRKFHRVGGTKDISCDVRVIAATNKDLAALVQQGEFRGDLYYRLNVLQLVVPPLRQRKDDLPVLIGHFLAYYNKQYGTEKTISASAMKKLLSLPWYGNIRELDNMIERLVLLSTSSVISDRYVQGCDTAMMPRNENELQSLKEAVEETEKRVLQAAYDRYHDCRSIADAVGVSYITVSRKLKQYGIR